MRLFMWYGNGVLEDYTSGQITVLANSLEEALETIKTEDKYCRSFPKNPTEVIDLDDPKLQSKAWITYGGA